MYKYNEIPLKTLNLSSGVDKPPFTFTKMGKAIL